MPGDGPDTVQDEGGQAHGLLLRAAILQSPWEGADPDAGHHVVAAEAQQAGPPPAPARRPPPPAARREEGPEPAVVARHRLLP